MLKKIKSEQMGKRRKKKIDERNLRTVEKIKRKMANIHTHVYFYTIAFPAH